jgi:hypothetical protein
MLAFLAPAHLQMQWTMEALDTACQAAKSHKTTIDMSNPPKQGSSTRTTPASGDMREVLDAAGLQYDPKTITTTTAIQLTSTTLTGGIKVTKD